MVFLTKFCYTLEHPLKTCATLLTQVGHLNSDSVIIAYIVLQAKCWLYKYLKTCVILWSQVGDLNSDDITICCVVKKCSKRYIWKGVLHLKSVIIAALTNLLFVRLRICISSGRNHLSSAGCVYHLIALIIIIIIIIAIINNSADVLIVSYPSRWPFSFRLGHPHWS